MSMDLGKGLRHIANANAARISHEVTTNAQIKLAENAAAITQESEFEGPEV